MDSKRRLLEKGKVEEGIERREVGKCLLRANQNRKLGVARSPSKAMKPSLHGV